jgi:hypothetical protein
VDINTGEPAPVPDRLDALKPAVRERDEIGLHPIPDVGKLYRLISWFLYEKTDKQLIF